MRIGLISDTHDNIDAVRAAVKIFNEQEVSHILHAGDIISPFVVREFKESLCPVTFIYGNNDGEILHLKQVISENNFILSGRFYHGKLGEKRLAMVHGDVKITESLIKSKLYDVIVSGHTHKRIQEKIGDVLHVNPGEACGYLTGEKSIAVLDTGDMAIDYIFL